MHLDKKNLNVLFLQYQNMKLQEIKNKVSITIAGNKQHIAFTECYLNNIYIKSFICKSNMNTFLNFIFKTLLCYPFIVTSSLLICSRIQYITFEASFTQHNAFGIHPSYGPCQEFILFYCIMYQSVYPSFTEGHLGCFQIFEIFNRAAKNIQVFV